MNISVRIEVFKEGDVYVALSPELNVSSFGETIDDVISIPGTPYLFSPPLLT